MNPQDIPPPDHILPSMNTPDPNQDPNQNQTYDPYSNPYPPYEPPKIEYKHSLLELEEEITHAMLQECKVDACVDLFVSRVNEAKKKPKEKTRRSRYIWGGPLVDVAIGETPEDTLKVFLDELRGNLERLVPGYLDEEGNNLLTVYKLKERMEKRWDVIARRNTRGLSQENDLPDALVETLMERRYKQYTGILGDPSDEAKEALTESCRQLRGLIEDERATASFSCGGSIPITTLDKDAKHKERVASLLVNIFWSKSNDSIATKLTLPINTSAAESSPETLQKLVVDCDIASFGRGEKDVIDPEYRRAGKINADQFATNFHPADYGILENIGQVLLPNISNETDNELGFRKITAELYKLNVYSSPSGHFKKHVDTPRAENQIGSLVVCLPSAFTGGKLSVEHHGQKIEFDWAEKSNNTIQWAAFYSDCEHEIETITGGDRVTLTYNLYVTEPVGGVIPSPTSIVEPRSLPVYGWMRDLLMQEDFMKDGGVLGLFCSHAYPHTSKHASSQLPRSLKGSDLVLYSVFASLGMNPTILPILENNGDYNTANPPLNIEGKTPDSGTFHTGQYEYYDYGFDNFLTKGQKPVKPNYTEVLPVPASAAECEDLEKRWKVLLAARRVNGMGRAFDIAEKNNLDRNEESHFQEQGVQVGIARHPYIVSDHGGEEDLDITVQKVWPVQYLPGITWVTEPKHEEMAFSHMAYGNEASMATRYSCASILAVIPPFEKRAELLR
ncbi:2OG-Fe(II) oxygenase [Aspergillus stella-maris]|uniref:2OG-Fe(II) oxygenase n=1 Tax=Aspergillus stella-maris TaxID=1810926 RepID=UPI003CCD485E